MTHILVIEDEKTCQFYLKDRLDKMGYKDVLIVDTGDKAIEILKDKSFDIILSDLMVPGQLSGVEMIKKFRELTPDTGLVVISGYPDAKLIHECEELGVKDFLTKPFELGFVSEIVKKMLKE